MCLTPVRGISIIPVRLRVRVHGEGLQDWNIGGKAGERWSSHFAVTNKPASGWKARILLGWRNGKRKGAVVGGERIDLARERRLAFPRSSRGPGIALVRVVPASMCIQGFNGVALGVNTLANAFFGGREKVRLSYARMAEMEDAQTAMDSESPDS